MTQWEESAVRRRRAMVLLIVLVVVVVLSLAAYAFTEMMLAQCALTEVGGRQVQAQWLAASGVARIRAMLMLDPDAQAEAGGMYDNPDSFQGVPIALSEGGTEVGRFTVLTPALDETDQIAGVRYGLQDESARVNLNALAALEQGTQVPGMESTGRNLLMALPGMTEDVADAILDWLDEDDEPREFGAEWESYADYAPKNGPLETVEELLLVRGVTPELLFGYDANRNGLIDANEMQSGGELSDTAARGWSAYLTLHSKENNANSLGTPRINLNTDDMQALYDSLSLVLPDEWAVFIVAYRQNGAYQGDEAGESYSSGELDLSQPGKKETQLNQVLDLIGKKVQVKFVGADEPTVLASPFKDDLLSMNAYMTTLMDNVTVANAVIPGRININQAPREILAGIPGMTEQMVEQIISSRTLDPAADDPSHQHETWILTSGIVTLDEMKSLMPLVCAGGDVYRAQVVGYYDDGQAAARLEVLLDATASPPRVLLWRDISHLGRGYPLEMLGVAADAMPPGL